MTKEIEKDYSLLRPFDLEKAKAGESICLYDGFPRTFIAGPDIDGDCCFSGDDGGFYIRTTNDYRMAPLCWVEGKPVYKGDGPLYFKKAVFPGENVEWSKHYVDLVDGKSTKQTSNREDSQTGWVNIDSLTWNPPAKPKVKKEGWVNVYGYDQPTGFIYSTREDADEYKDRNCIACIRIEWEE